MEEIRRPAMVRRLNLLLPVAAVTSAVAVMLPRVLSYIPLDFEQLLCLMALSFVLRFDSSRRMPAAWILAPALFMAGYAATGIHSLALSAMLFILLVAAGAVRGRFSLTAPVVLLLMCSVFRYIEQAGSFWLRLNMTAGVAGLLDFLPGGCRADGCVLTLRGETFAVDPPCAGLYSMLTGLVIMLALTGYREQKLKTAAGWPRVGFILLSGIVFLLFANFLRIIILVLLKIPPDSILHDITGLYSLLISGILPSWLIIRLIIRKNASDNKSKTASSSFRYKTLLFVFLICLPFASFLYQPEAGIKGQVELPEAFRNFSQDWTSENGIWKTEKENCVIYLKSPVAFYQASHDPQICWRGSGYVFRRERMISLAGSVVNTAQMRKADADLSTVWWFDNRQQITAGSMDWRISSARGKGGFWLVNVTGEDPETVKRLAELLLQAGN